MRLRAYKYRLYPTKEQESLLAQFFGAKRWIFNHYLHEQKSRFSAKEKHLSNFDINKDITQLKNQPETSWLRGIDDWCLKHASEDLSVAYQNFFNSITGKRKGKSELPKFKDKTSRQSYRTRGVKVGDGFVYLPKIKQVKAVIHREFDGIIKSATISKNTDGRYYISVLVEEETKTIPSAGKEIGVDLGIKDILTLSDGIKFKSPSVMLEKANRAVKRQQLKLSRKVKGSKNYEKQKLKVARAFSKVTRVRNEYYHLISNFLVNNYDAIYMEDLNVAGMLKNRKLSRALHEASFSTLVEMISYKCGYYGKTFHQVDRWFASSKTCNCCEHKLDKSELTLSTREWVCPKCNSLHDRDINAAINIKNRGQLDCYDEIIPNVTVGKESRIPMALMKNTTKTEKSSQLREVGVGIEQATRSLVAW